MYNGSIKRKIQYSWRFALLDMATLLFIAGIVSSVSTWGNSNFTLSLILAGGAIEAIRRFSPKVITGAMVAVDLVTITLLAGIVSNPLLWGMPFIAATLLTWVIIQSVRYFIGKATHPISAGVQIVMTFCAIYAMGMLNLGAAIGASAYLVLWILGEVAWAVIDQKWLGNLKAKRVLSELQPTHVDHEDLLIQSAAENIEDEHFGGVQVEAVA